ncbi:MAG: MurR/RpiR family transcriptional regulator [Shouchella clausii]
MNVSDVLTVIKSIYPSLTKSEQRVAQYITEHYDHFVFPSLTEFARECGVGEATVFRFFKKLGFSGYHEFKTNMAKQLRNPTPSTFSTEVQETYEEIIQMLNDTRNLADNEVLKKAATWIMESRSIYLFGIGFSGLAAQGAQIRLMRLGYKAYAFSDQHTQFISSHLISEGDLAIAFSITGDTKETIRWLENAKKNKAKSIAITNHSHSPITNIGEMIIHTAGKEIEQEGSTLITQMSQLFVTEQICQHLYELDKDNIELAKKKISESID